MINLHEASLEATPEMGADYYGRILELADEAEALLKKSSLTASMLIPEAVFVVVTRHIDELADQAAKFHECIIKILEGRKAHQGSGFDRPEQTVPGNTFVARAAAAQAMIEERAPVIDMPEPPLNIKPQTEEQQELF